MRLPAYTIRNAVTLLGALSAAALIFAVGSQKLSGYAPCELCLIQRWWHCAVVGAAILLLVLRRRARLFLTIQTAALLICCGYSVFHVGVEREWWEGTAMCTGATGANTLEALRAQIMNAPVVRCGDVRWTLLGLSMATYDAILTAGMAGFAIFTGIRRK